MNIEEMTLDQVNTRLKEIKEESRKADADIDALTDEVEKLNARKSVLEEEKRTTEKRNALQNMVIEDGVGTLHFAAQLDADDQMGAVLLDQEGSPLFHRHAGGLRRLPGKIVQESI